MNIIIGNVIAFLAASVMVLSGIIYDRKKIIFVQTMQMILFAISNLVLGGFTGAIINVISIIRNILSYNDSLGTKEKIIIIILGTIFSLLFNNLGIIGILPLITLILFVLFMNTKDNKKFKILIIATMILWAIYDYWIKSYTSMAFDLLTILTSLISLIANTIKRK